jgi:hypothetical protein
MVQHDDIPRSQRGAEHLLHTGAKDVSIGGPLHGHDRLESDAEGAQPRDIRPIVQRDGPDAALSPRGPAIQAGHREIDAGFIHKLHAPEIE